MTSVKRPKIFGTGLIALDLVMSADPETPVQSWTGGTCGNVMAILAYLGWKAYPIARMNGDPASDRVRADLLCWDVNLEFAACTPTAHTPIIVQQIQKARDGSPTHRFLWSCPRCGQRLPSFKAVTQEAVDKVTPSLPGTAVFFMDRLSRAALSLAARASTEGAIVVFEPSGKSDEKLFAEAIKLAHIVKYSDQRLTTVEGVMQPDGETLLEVQTLGSEGLRYRHRLGKGISDWSHLNAIAAPRLVDSCGAGDWCTAGFLAKIAAQGKTGFLAAGADAVRHALQYGQALAAWNCGFEGARGGMYAIKRETMNRHIEAILEGRPNLSVVKRKVADNISVACPACPSENTRRPRAMRHQSRRSATKSAA